MWGPAIIFLCYSTGCFQFVFTPGPEAEYRPTGAACVEHWGGLTKEKFKENPPDKIIVRCKDYAVKDKGPLV